MHMILPRCDSGLFQQCRALQQCMEHSIERVSWVCADVAPIVLRLLKGRQLAPGPFTMGRLQPWVNVGALLYILFSTVSISHITCSSSHAEHLRCNAEAAAIHACRHAGGMLADFRC